MIDFTIIDGNAGGLRVELAAGDDAPDLSTALSIDEDAFFLIDYFIRTQLAKGAAYDHYGVTRIESATWAAIVHDMAFASEQILGMLQKSGSYAPFQIECLAALPLSPSDDTAERDELAFAISRFLRELAIKTESWSASYHAVFVLGV